MLYLTYAILAVSVIALVVSIITAAMS
jgi:hypothetical protein